MLLGYVFIFSYRSKMKGKVEHKFLKVFVILYGALKSVLSFREKILHGEVCSHHF